MSEEIWQVIPEFPNYEISSYGRIYNIRQDAMMRTSHTSFGHSKITLTSYNGSRHTRSVALLVAEAFVEPYNFMCDYLMVLDGNFSNLISTNLAWRPRWFAWKYTRQLKVQQPLHFRNLVVRNIVEDIEYETIIDAGMSEGLLFVDIWRSTYTGISVFPTGSVFEIVNRV